MRCETRTSARFGYETYRTLSKTFCKSKGAVLLSTLHWLRDYASNTIIEPISEAL